MSPTAERAVSGAVPVPVQTINIGGHVGTVNAPAVGNVDAFTVNGLNTLSSRFAEWFPNPDTAERLWVTAGGRAGVALRNTTPRSMWYELFRSAKQGAIASPLLLVLAAQHELPDNQILRTIVDNNADEIRRCMGSAQQAHAPHRAKPTRNEMVDMLARLPLCGTWSGRNALVVGFAGYFSRTEHDDKRIDIGKIVDQSWNMDRERAWAKLLDAAYRQVRGTGLGNQILAARNALG